MIRTLRFGTELRRFFRSRMTSLAILVAICIPLLYGALYLWAFWNPYDHLNRLPVALVNDDRAVTATDGTAIHAGYDVTTAILDAGSLGWRQTTDADAKAGLATGAYYAVVTIPEGFSASVASVTTADPSSAAIDVTYDDANGYTTRTLLASVMRELRSSVSSTLGDTMVSKVLLGLNDISSGLDAAHSGAVTLAGGAASLSTGAAQAASGASTAADGAKSLASGANSASAGAAKLAAGASTLANGAASVSAGATQVDAGARSVASGAASLDTGVQAVAAGAEQVAAGTSSVATGAGKVKDGTKALADAASGISAQGAATLSLLQTLVAALPDSDPNKATYQTQIATLTAELGGLATQAGTVATGANQVAAAAAVVSSGASTVSAGAQKAEAGSSALVSGASQVATGADQVATGASQVSSGATTLSTSSGQLADGLTTLDSGAAKLATGTADLASGTQKVADGASSVSDGAGSLRDGLATALAKVPTFSDASGSAQTMSDPVSLSSAWSNEASSMGEGYAPYFVGLALYVGALILWMLLRPIPKGGLAAPVSALRLVLSGGLPALTLGVAQVGLLFAVLLGGLGLHPAHLLATLAFGVLVSVAFVSLQQMISIWLGPAVGRLLVLVLLMLQLTSAGGMFPAVTSPALFQALNAVLPMTRVVNGFREALTGDLSSVFATSVTYLVVLIALNVVMATWGAARQRTWTMRTLHPDVSL